MTQVTLPGPHHYEVKVDSVIIRNNFSITEEEDRFTIVIDRVAEPQDEQNNPIGSPVRLPSLYLPFKNIKNDVIPDVPQMLTVEQVFFLCMKYIQSKKGDGL